MGKGRHHPRPQRFSARAVAGKGADRHGSLVVVRCEVDLPAPAVGEAGGEPGAPEKRDGAARHGHVTTGARGRRLAEAACMLPRIEGVGRRLVARVGVPLLAAASSTSR